MIQTQTQSHAAVISETIIPTELNIDNVPSISRNATTELREIEGDQLPVYSQSVKVLRNNMKKAMTGHSTVKSKVIKENTKLNTAPSITIPYHQTTDNVIKSRLLKEHKTKDEVSTESIFESNLSYRYGKQVNEIKPVSIPIDKNFRYILKGSGLVGYDLVIPPSVVPLGHKHLGGVYGTLRYDYNHIVSNTDVLELYQ